MARYVNADEAVNALKRWLKFPDYNKGEKNIIACAITMLEEAPTADVVEWKRGKWIRKAKWLWQGYECSLCGYEIASRTNYCQNCGADMRKVDNLE